MTVSHLAVMGIKSPSTEIPFLPRPLSLSLSLSLCDLNLCSHFMACKLIYAPCTSEHRLMVLVHERIIYIVIVHESSISLWDKKLRLCFYGRFVINVNIVSSDTFISSWRGKWAVTYLWSVASGRALDSACETSWSEIDLGQKSRSSESR